MTKRIFRLAAVAAATVAFALPAAPAQAQCVFIGTFPFICLDDPAS